MEDFEIIENYKNAPLKESYITISESVNASVPIFNNIKDVITRNVTISGVTQIWGEFDSLDQEEIGVRRLFDYCNSLNIQTLELFADEIIIKSPLHFPQTEVKIHARVLKFEGNGSIITTPEQFSSGAFQLKRKNILPLDDKGEVKAADGKAGLKGGNIWLYVMEPIVVPDDKIRFVTKGSNGQDAEEGGYLEYQSFEGQSTSPLPLGQLPRRCQDFTHWISQMKTGIYPGYEVIFPPGYQNTLSQYTVIGIKLIAYNDSINFFGFTGGPKNCNGDAGVPISETSTGTPIWPASGPDAYPPGTPGKGGDSGNIHLLHNKVKIGEIISQNFLQLLDNGAAVPGKKTNDVKSYSQEYVLTNNKPFAYITMESVLAYGPIPSTKIATIKVSATTIPNGKAVRSGNPASGSSNYSGTAASVNYIPTNYSNPVPSTTSLEAIIHYAKDAFIAGHRDLTATVLQPYFAFFKNNPLFINSIPQLAYKTELKAYKTELESLQHKLNSNLDYFNNPPGWVPRLSALSNLLLFNNSKGSSISLMYYGMALENRWDKKSNRIKILSQNINNLSQEIEDSQKVYKQSLELFKNEGIRFEQIEIKINSLKDKLKKLNNEIQSSAEMKEKNQELVSGIFKIASAFCKCIPVGQPYIGAAGSVFDAASEIDINSDNAFEEAFKFGNNLGKNIKDFSAKQKDEVLKSSNQMFDGKLKDANNSIENIDLKIEEITADNEKVEKDEKEIKSGNLENLKSKIEKQKADLESEKEKRAEKINGVFTHIEKISDGVSEISGELSKLIKKVDPNDPKILALKAKIAESEYYKPKLQEIMNSLEELTTDKQKLLEGMQRAVNMSTDSFSKINKNLISKIKLSDQKQQLGAGLDINVKLYAKNIKIQAQERLYNYFYHFIKSFQYRYLTNFEDDILGSNIISKIIEFENKHPNDLLDEEVFNKIYENNIKNTFEELANKLIEKQQHLKPLNENKYRLQLSNDQLIELNKNWSIRFNPIKDFKAGSRLYTNARIISIAFAELDITTQDKSLVLDFEFAHSGTSIILGPDQKNYKFVIGKYLDKKSNDYIGAWVDDDPISWNMVYNHLEGSDKISADEKSDSDHLIKFLLLNEKGEEMKSKMFTEHRPGYNSDIILSIDKKRLIENRGEKDKEFKINKLEFFIYYERGA